MREDSSSSSSDESLELTASQSNEVIIYLWEPNPQRNKDYGHIAMEIPAEDLYISFCPKQNSSEARFVGSYNEDYNQIMNDHHADKVVKLYDLNIEKMKLAYEKLLGEIEEGVFTWKPYGTTSLLDCIGEPIEVKDEEIGGLTMTFKQSNCAALVKYLLEIGGLNELLPYKRMTYDEGKKLSWHGHWKPFCFFMTSFVLELIVFNQLDDDITAKIFLFVALIFPQIYCVSKILFTAFLFWQNNISCCARLISSQGVINTPVAVFNLAKLASEDDVDDEQGDDLVIANDNEINYVSSV